MCSFPIPLDASLLQIVLLGLNDLQIDFFGLEFMYPKAFAGISGL